MHAVYTTEGIYRVFFLQFVNLKLEIEESTASMERHLELIPIYTSPSNSNNNNTSTQTLLHPCYHHQYQLKAVLPYDFTI